MKPMRKALFLERDTYRRRRIMDAARILPVVGLVLILLPALWSRGGGTNVAAEAVYLFVLWGVLVVVAAILSRSLRASSGRDRRAGANGSGDPRNGEPRDTDNTHDGGIGPGGAP